MRSIPNRPSVAASTTFVLTVTLHEMRIGTKTKALLSEAARIGGATAEVTDTIDITSTGQVLVGCNHQLPDVGHIA